MRDAEQIRFLVLAAQREGNRRLAQALRPLGVTPSQAEVLALLARRQPMTLGGLGELLVCESGSSPSRLVDRLVAADLVRRVEVPHDRRQVELTLTDAGRRAAAGIAEVEEELYDQIDAACAGHDLQALAAALRALIGDQPSARALDRRAAEPAASGGQ